MVGIYRITNLKTGDFYIGQSKNIKKRIQHHKDSARHSPKFEADIAQYGWDGFSVDVLEECNERDLLEREAYYIEKMKPTYNVICRGKALAQETRLKISNALTGRHQDRGQIEKRRQSILKRHKAIPQTNEGHRKPVLLDMGNGGQPIARLESVKAAAEFLDVHPSTVTKALKRNGKVKGHKVWYEV